MLCLSSPAPIPWDRGGGGWGGKLGLPCPVSRDNPGSPTWLILALDPRERHEGGAGRCQQHGQGWGRAEYPSSSTRRTKKKTNQTKKKPPKKKKITKFTRGERAVGPFWFVPWWRLAPR